MTTEHKSYDAYAWMSLDDLQGEAALLSAELEDGSISAEEYMPLSKLVWLYIEIRQHEAAIERENKKIAGIKLTLAAAAQPLAASAATSTEPQFISPFKVGDSVATFVFDRPLYGTITETDIFDNLVVTDGPRSIACSARELSHYYDQPQPAPAPVPAAKATLSKAQRNMLTSLPRNIYEHPLRGTASTTAKSLIKLGYAQMRGMMVHQQTLTITEKGREALK